VRGDAGMVRRGRGIRFRSFADLTEELLGVRSMPSPKPLFLCKGEVPPIEGDDVAVPVKLANPLSPLPWAA
jgi:hypothetical protein